MAADLARVRGISGSKPGYVPGLLLCHYQVSPHALMTYFTSVAFRHGAALLCCQFEGPAVEEIVPRR